eukprot:960938-Pyramimonas_sp.AAC.1
MAVRAPRVPPARGDVEPEHDNGTCNLTPRPSAGTANQPARGHGEPECDNGTCALTPVAAKAP